MADADSPLFRFRLWRAALPPALRLLLTANVGLYVLWVLSLIFGLGALFLWLALDPAPAVVLSRPWTPLTYTLANLYPGFFGLLSFVFAMLWLNWMGRDYEETYGSYRLFGLYALAALFGAAVAVGLAAMAGGTAGPFRHPLYFGAWGPVTAVLCALATLQPNRGIGLFLLGVVPLKWLAIGFVVLDLAFVQDPTHLAAALFGFAFAKAQAGGVDLAAWARPLFRQASGSYAAYGAAAAGPSVGARVKRLLVREAPEERPGGAVPRRHADRSAAPGSPARAGQDEVDRILDKILDNGGRLDVLTDEERRILDEASRRS
jgi:membrane associated rhomboid family serine protease